MKTILLFLITFLLFSCSNTEKKEIGTYEEIGVTMSGYIDTLEWGIKDAKSVRDMMNENGNDLQKNIQESLK